MHIASTYSFLCKPIVLFCFLNEDPDCISKNLVLCSLHFTAHSFTNKPQFDVGFSERLKLKDDAVDYIGSDSNVASQV